MTTDAAAIAAQIDTATTAGHNLRALLLRLLDGESLRQEGFSGVLMVLEQAESLGLADTDHACTLTPLGREVAELLRPAPWSAFMDDGGSLWLTSLDDRRARFTGGSPERDVLASRIAELLNRDVLEQAKRYQ
jgi:hypothetical protein